jgi:hypothetical protein
MAPIDNDEFEVLRLAGRLGRPLSWYQVERALFPLGAPAPTLLDQLAEKGLLHLVRQEGPMRWFSITDEGRRMLDDRGNWGD